MRLVADENFNGRIVRGILRLKPDLDLVRVQDVGLMTTPDPDILEWAAQEKRILITHDCKTIPPKAYERVQIGKRMPGVFLVDDKLQVGEAVQALLLLAECSLEGEWENQVRYLPW